MSHPRHSPETARIPLAGQGAHFYVAAMSRTHVAGCWPALLLAATLCGSLAGQEDYARAAAEREAIEERFRQLNSDVQSLITAQTDLRSRMEKLSEALQKVRTELSSRAADSTFVTREEFNRLVETVREIDRKREADKKQILEEIEALGKSLNNSLQNALKKLNTAPAPRVEPRPEHKPEVTPESRPEAADPNQKGAWHTIQNGDTLYTIVAAYNEYWKGQRLKTTLALIKQANPKVKPEALSVGQKIFVPLVPLQN